MIDTHCHLEMNEFNADRDTVIRRAKEVGLEAVINVGSDLPGCIGAVELSREYDFINAAVGIHPHDAKDFSEEIFDRIKAWASEGHDPLATMDSDGSVHAPKIVAIGEIGLDYHYDLSPRGKQREVFGAQLRFAKEAGLPVIVHSREAQEETLEILARSGVNKGVMHCFSGDMKMAEETLAMGLYISFAGTVTFKKAHELAIVAKSVPDERLLVETDAPYLAPVPYRGKRNEPAYVMETAKFLAGLRGVSIEDIDRITTLNAKRLFGIGEADAGKIAYKIRDSLYLNITNRCTNKCGFCIRYQSDFVKGHNLRLEKEPTEKELKQAIGDPSSYREIVFCGYGEPTLRFDVIKSIAAWVKERGGKVRINTNGHGNVINKRDILPELKGLVDALSVSLDAQDGETYDKICRPVFKDAFAAVVDFLRGAKLHIPDVKATVVEMEGVDVEKCGQLCASLGIKLRVRKLDIVG
jgi:TatD DNase family protein